jgi:hypothetical protein
LEQVFESWLKRFQEPTKQEYTQITGRSLYPSVTDEKPAEKQISVGNMMTFS